MADNKSKKLDCPKCVGLLETKEVGELQKYAVVIDQCPMCKGIWLDEGELSKLLKDKLGFDDEVPEEEFHQHWKDDFFDLKKAKCPRCKKEMQRVKSAQDSRVTTDYCLECGGTWLDGGEIRELLRGGPIHRALHFIFNKISEPLQNIKDRGR